MNRFVVLFVLLCAPLFGLSAQNSRAALVIGNSAYASSPLVNPVNDATDIAAALREQGFDVVLRTDLDYEGMDAALSAFEKALKGKDTALFYYAGHGVQADGENYLIPVKEDITSVATARSRGLPLGEVLGRIKDAGVATALIFLDACRNNPFAGSSRSGTRGLAAVAPPRDVETLIAYATQPGDVAQDGSGRNGVFTAAVLKNLSTPGKTVGEVMTQVKADVKAATGGKQQPRVDDGLSKAFYFNDPVLAAAKAKLASEKSAAELAALDAQLVALQAKLSSAKTKAEKDKLQVEQQRQQALQAAKKLEADNLAADAARKQAAAQQAQLVAAQRQSAAAETLRQQNELGNLAATRRAELDKLATAGASENPDVLIETVERLDVVLKEVDAQYGAALAKSLANSNSSWDAQLKAIDKEEPDIVETDAEFAARQAKERATLEANRQAELKQLRSTAESLRVAQTASIRSQFETTLKTLQTRNWTMTGNSVKLTVGAFDRNEKSWNFLVATNDKSIPAPDQVLQLNLQRVADSASKIREVDAAAKAGALAGEIDWGVQRRAGGAGYTLELRAVRVRNLANASVVVEATQVVRIGAFVPGHREAVSSLQGTLKVLVPLFNPTGGTVYVNGLARGTAPLELQLPKGPVAVEVRWPEKESMAETSTFDIAAGKVATFATKHLIFKVGDLGPAGGRIIYDKGVVSDGWRFIEAAAKQAYGVDSARKDGSNEPPLVRPGQAAVATSDDIGAGRANTEALANASTRGTTVASLALLFTWHGFDDWFLPSKGELEVLLNYLDFLDTLLWSSSMPSRNEAWIFNLGKGIVRQQASSAKAPGDFKIYFRPIRYF